MMATINCFYSTTVDRIETGIRHRPANGDRGNHASNASAIIARLGAIPPRGFVESCGVRFPSDDPTTLPELTGQYESNVPGLYIIGALGGYPLIKQAMNQGYEVAEYIAGNDILPADHEVLAAEILRFAVRYRRRRYPGAHP